MSTITIFGLNGNILASSKEKEPFKIDNITCVVSVEPNGYLNLCKYVASDTRQEAYNISIKAIKEEFYRRKYDSNVLKNDINALMIQITEGNENAEELGSEMTRLLLLKGEHQKHIKELQDQTKISVTYQQIRNCRISLLPPGVFIKLSWLSNPIMWCRSVEEKEEKKVLAVTEEIHIPPLTNTDITKAHIYLAGGKSAEGRLSSLQRYEIEGNQWVSIESMKQKRSGGAMATLDGQLYIAGGFDGSSDTKSMERYIPSENKWNAMTSMTSKRSAFGMAAEGGYLYAVGGLQADDDPLDSGERYNPNQNIWEEITPMTIKRSYHNLVAFNGYLYAIGGRDSSNSPVSSVEKYCPEEEKWITIPQMNFKRWAFGTAVLFGKLYVIGGFDRSELASVEYYDPYHNKWSVTKSMNTARGGLATAAADGKLYALGGMTSDSGFVSNVEMYDPLKDKWTEFVSAVPKINWAASSLIPV